MIDSGDEIETQLPDLSGYSLGQLLAQQDDLDEKVDAVLGQVQRPRINLGSSGPPGRAD